MITRPRDRVFVVGSALALLAALLAGIWMLLRARGVWEDEREADERVELLARRDDLRGDIAEITSQRRLAALPGEYDLAADLRDVLRSTARAFQDDPLDGSDDPGVFACVALEVAQGEDGLTVWTSGAIDPEDRSWCLTAISSGGADSGSRHLAGDTRILGVTWAAFRVAGEPRIGALAWITPLSR